MKKRVLAMLLLAAMIVTALPLAVIPSLAAEKSAPDAPTYGADEYNALYVQDGLVLAFDIMQTNAYWKEAMEEFPKSPMTYTDYVYEGKHYNFTDPLQRFDFDTEYYLIQQKSSTSALCLANSTVTIDGTEYKNLYHHYTDKALATKGAKVTADAMAASKNAGNDGFVYSVVKTEVGYDVMRAKEGESSTAYISYTVMGPYKATVVRATKSGNDYVGWTELLQSVNNAVGYATKDDAIAAAKRLAGGQTEQNALGGYDQVKGSYAYFVTGMDQNAAYKKAGADYYNAVNAWLAKYTWKAEKASFRTGSNPSTTANIFNRRRDSYTVYAAIEDVVAEQGYIVRQRTFCADQGIQLTLPQMTNGATMEMAVSLTTLSNDFILFYDMRPKFEKDANGKLTDKIKSMSAFTASEITAGTYESGVLDTLRFTVTNSAVGGEDTVKLTHGDTLMFSAKGTYTGSNGNNILGYSDSLPKAEIYSFRSYNRVLSDTESARNHLVDLLKYFRMDLGYIKLLDDDHLAKVAEVAAPYTFESDAQAVTDAILAAACVQAEAQFTNIPADLVTVIAKYGLDPSIFSLYPLYYLTNVYEFLLVGYIECDDAEEIALGYEAAIAADYEAMWEDTDKEKPYNALYVQENLVMAADFFKLNEYWNVDGKTYALPVGPSENKAYLAKDGKTYDLTKDENRYELNADGSIKYDKDGKTPVALSAVFTEAAKSWVTDNANYMNKNFVWTETAYGFSTYRSTAVGFAKTAVAPYKFEDGYIQFRNDYYSSGGMIFSLPGNMTAATGELVMAYAYSTNGSSTVPFLFHNVRPRLTSNDAGVSLNGFSSSYFGGSSYATEKDYIAPLDTPFTMANSLSLSSTANADNFKIRVGQKTLVDLTAEYGSSAAAIENVHYVGWGDIQPFIKMYAYRHYDRVLSDPELARNHFADIMKWYKLDIRGVDLNKMDTEALYKAFENVTFNSHTRAEVQDILATYAIKPATAEYEARYEGYRKAGVPERYVEVGYLYGLDLDGVAAGLPYGYLKNAYTVLNDLVANLNVAPDFENAAARYSAALAADTAKSGISDMTADQYTALYVQDGLAFGVDFFTSNEYWSNAADSKTGKAADIRDWLNTYRYPNPRTTFAVSLSPETATATVKDGYLDLSPFYLLYPSGLDGYVNKGVNFVTSEQVRTYTSSSAVGNLLALRIYADPLTGELTSIIHASADYLKDAAAVAASNALGKTYYSDMSKVATYTNMVQRDTVTHPNSEATITEYQLWNKAGDGRISYAINSDIYSYTTDGDVVTVDLTKPVYTMAVHGEGISGRIGQNGTYGTHKVMNLRTYPGQAITPDYVINANGERVENTAGKQYWVAIEGNRYVKGEAHLYQNGVKIYENTDIDHINSKYYEGGDNYIVLWGQSGSAMTANPGKLYAARYYEGALTDAQMAQNHFVDIVKFYRLDLTEYLTFNTDERAIVHASFAGLQLAECTRAEAVVAYQSGVQKVYALQYKAMAKAHPEIVALNPVLFEIAAAYRLDLDAIFNSDRDMRYAIVNVTDAALAGKDFDEAGAYLADLVYDAYNYVYSEIEGETVWNTWLRRLINEDVRVDLTQLMSLPLSVRMELANKAVTDPAAITAFAEEKLAKYNPYSGSMTPADYNRLYVDGDGSKGLLMFAFDLMETNEYWQMEIAEFPVAPVDNDNYIYNGEKYDFTENANRLGGYNFSLTTGGKTSYPNATKASYDTLEELEAAILTYDKKAVYDEEKGYWLNDNGTEDTADDKIYQVVDEVKKAYRQAAKDFYADESAWLATYTWYAKKDDKGNPIVLFSYDAINSAGNCANHIKNAGLVHSTFAPMNGYITMRGDYCSDAGLQTSSSMANNVTDSVSRQLTASLGNSRDAFLLFYDARPVIATVNGQAYYTGKSGNAISVTTEIPEADRVYMNVNEVLSLTVAITGIKTAHTAENPDTFVAKTPTKTLIEIKSKYNGDNDKANGTNYIGYGNRTKDMNVYAIRDYTRDLTDAEMKQNHFIDLAKWYRIDLTEYVALSDEAKAAIHNKFVDHSINGEADRDALVKLYQSLLTNDYEVAENVLDTEVVALARELGLDVSALVAANDAGRAYAEEIILSELRAGTAFSRTVAQALVDQALIYKSSFAYEGVQVRLHSNASGDMPGVRAIFTANKSVLDAYAEISKDFAFGVEICDKNGKALAILRFAPDGDGNYSGTNTLASGASAGKAIITPVGENSLAFAYTVIFDTAETQTAAYYNVEFSYRFFFEVNGLRNNANMLKSENFGNTISAAEAYSYFYANGFADDGVVAGVMKEIYGDAIIVTTPEEAQEALDNAEAGTTIQLAPGVDYGKLVFRQNASGKVVDITSAGGDAPGNEKYRRIENLTIRGADGATVDGFDFAVGWIDGSGASFIDVENLTVEGVTFSGEATPFNFEGAKGSALGIDGLTIVNCRMNDADGNNRFVFQQISGYKVLNDKSTGEYVMTTGIKDLTITGCEIVGAYMVIESRAMENLTITNNTFEGIKERDMLITSDTTYYPNTTYTGAITITGNTSIRGEERFVRGSLNNSDAVVVIKDNTIIDYRGADADFIKVTGGNNVTIENNTQNP